MNTLRSLFLAVLFLSACSSPQYLQTVKQEKGDGKYDSEFPAKPTDSYIYTMSRSIRLISSLTFYRTYSFRKSDLITRDEINSVDFNIEQRAAVTAITQKPSSGTATIIFAEQRKVLVLTCAHVVYEPDTMISYFLEETGGRSQFVQTFSIKLKQNIHINGLPRGENPEIIFMDRKKDLALIGKDLYQSPQKRLPVFPFKWGAAKELKWGSFVYLMGFPSGKKMVSTAIVSDPNRSGDHNFLIDASLHRGVSGGIILALRDGPPHFEWVGIVNALAAQNQYVLRPDPATGITDLNRNKPYEGDIFIDRRMSVSYGVTYAISIEAIRSFIRSAQKRLTLKGFNFSPQ